MNTEAKSPGQELQQSPAREQRRSQRVVIRIPVRLHLLTDSKAQALAGRTVAVNDHGALINLPSVFPAGTRVEVENLANSLRQVGKVLRPPTLTPLGFEVPIEFDRVVPGFWGIAFPPSDWKPVRE